MDNYTKAEIIIKYMDEIQETIHKRHHEIAKKHNLTVDQFHLMLHLDMKKSPPTINEMAAAFNISQNTMSEKITRLSQRNLIAKVKDPEDKRISRIQLSTEGKELVNNICYESEINFVNSAVTRMEENKIDSLLSSLKDLSSKLKEE